MGSLLLALIGACGGRPPPSEGAAPGAERVDEIVEDATHVAVGSGVHAYAGCVVRDGRVFCWGGPNVIHALGRRHGLPMAGPSELPGLSGAVQVEIGGRAVCARLEDGAVRCGAPPEAPRDVGVRGAVQLSSGTSHSCARLRDGRVECWGQNIGFGIGVRSARQVDELPPTRVPGVERAVDVAVGTSFACAAIAEGGLWCWGAHPMAPRAAGQEQLAVLAAPAPVPGAPPARRVVAAGAMVCVVTLDGEVACARGRDDRGPAAFEAVEPREELRDPMAFAVGPHDACFVGASGRVRCWGPGPTTYVVDGATWEARLAAGYDRAVAVPDLGDAAQVAVTRTHRCARTRGGRVRCWGTNEHGQLGDGTTLPRVEPSYVTWFRPPLHEPPHGVGGCRAGAPLRRRCADRGDACALEAPPGYWAPARRGGRECDPECEAETRRELERRPIPACTCACDGPAP